MCTANGVSYAYIYIFFFRFFSLIGFKILSIVPCAIQYCVYIYIFFFFNGKQIGKKGDRRKMRRLQGEARKKRNDSHPRKA